MLFFCLYLNNLSESYGGAEGSRRGSGSPLPEPSPAIRLAAVAGRRLAGIHATTATRPGRGSRPRLAAMDGTRLR